MNSFPYYYIQYWIFGDMVMVENSKNNQKLKNPIKTNKIVKLQRLPIVKISIITNYLLFYP
jgi:hypothetical protein